MTEASSFYHIIIGENETIESYEALVIQVLQQENLEKLLIENMPGPESWNSEDVKQHIRRVAPYLTRFTHLKHRAAIVAAKPVDYGLGKIAQGNLEPLIPGVIEVFFTREEALDWLKK